MALLQLPKKLHPDFRQPNQKPTGRVQLDTQNKYYKNRVLFVPGVNHRGDSIEAHWQELPSGLMGSPVWPQSDFAPFGITSVALNAGWLNINQGGNDGKYISDSGIDALAGNSTDGQTWIVKCKDVSYVSNGSSLNTIFGYHDISHVAICVNSSNQLDVRVDNLNSVYTDVDLSDGQEYTIAVCIFSNVTKVYVNGVYKGSDISNTGFNGDSSDKITLGGSQANIGRDCRCKIQWAGVWNRPFSGSEVLDVSMNPWQQLRPATPFLYSYTTGAGPTPLTVAPSLTSELVSVLNPSVTEVIVLSPNLTSATATVDSVALSSLFNVLPNVVGLSGTVNNPAMPYEQFLSPSLTNELATVSNPSVLLPDIISPSLTSSVVNVATVSLESGAVTILPLVVSASANPYNPRVYDPATFVPGFYSNESMVDYFRQETGLDSYQFNELAKAYYEQVAATNPQAFNDSLIAAQQAAGFVGLAPTDWRNF